MSVINGGNFFVKHTRRGDEKALVVAWSIESLQQRLKIDIADLCPLYVDL